MMMMIELTAMSIMKMGPAQIMFSFIKVWHKFIVYWNEVWLEENIDEQILGLL